MAQREKNDQRKDAEGRNQAYEKDRNKRKPMRLIRTIPVDIRGEEADQRDNDRRKRYPEPHAFLLEDAHGWAKYNEFSSVVFGFNVFQPMDRPWFGKQNLGAD